MKYSGMPTEKEIVQYHQVSIGSQLIEQIVLVFGVTTVLVDLYLLPLLADFRPGPDR